MRSIGLLTLVLPGLLAGQSLLFDRITTAHGLPSEEIQVLFEDRDGFIWAGTQDGLARLEGARIRVFHHDQNDSTSLAHDQVNSIAQDAAGRLWFATMDGLSRLDAQSGTFINRRIAATGNDLRQANRMRQVLAIGDSLLWLVSEAGLYRYHIPSASFEYMQGRPTGEGPAGMIGASGDLFWDAARGTLWAGTTEGLASWDVRTRSWTDHRNSKNEPWATISVTNVPVVHGDSLWFLRNKPYTLFAFDLERQAILPQPDLEDRPNLFGLRSQGFDATGGHWLGTWTHRLFLRPKNGSWHEVRADATTPGAIASSRVSGFLSTRIGAWWLATRAGIAILHPASTATRLLTFSADGHAITALRLLQKDTLLVGTDGDGVHVLDLRTGKNSRHAWRRPGEVEGAEELANSIRAIGPRFKGRFLIGTGYGLALLDPHVQALMAMRELDAAFPDARRSAFDVVERDGAVLWIGTWSKGLWRYDEGSGACELVDTVPGPYGQLPNRRILSWLTDREGRHWVGLNDGGGLACMENGRFRSIIDADGGNLGGVVRVVAQGPDGRIWLGTHERGLLVHDPSTGGTRYFTRRDGLPGTRIVSLLFTRDGSLWVAVKGGFARMLPGSRAFRSFSLPAGFPGAEASALVELPDGRIVLGCGEHLLLHDPSVRATTGESRAVFTGYRVKGRYSMGAPPSLELPHDRKAISLELGTVGGDPRILPLFRYRLSPEEDGWNELGTSARIDLFDLSPGSYSIDVQCSEDGVNWGAGAARAQVTVLPPFHATWWFRASVVAVMSALLFLAFRLYVRERLRKQRETFEREQAVLQERVRIAGDMHDDLGAGLSALKLRSEMALRVEKDPVKREQLGSLARTAGDLIGSMRQIIWTMNADQSSVADLVSYTTHYMRNYCEQNSLAPEILANGEWPAVQLTSEQRRNIFLVVKEALHNVVKHANARTVRLALSWNDGLVVEVQDDGVGLPSHAQQSVGNGLRNMRKRIETLGGTIGMEVGMGRPGDLAGTCIRFSVPLVANQGSIVRPGPSQDLRRS